MCDVLNNEKANLKSLKKIMQACKPGSVKSAFRQTSLIIYLALTLPSGSISLPNHTSLHYQRVAGHFREHDLFGLSTRKVCQAHAITGVPVSSYLTFSPFPITNKW